MQPFGAFVELGPGREGLVHVTQLNMTLVADAAAAVSPGDSLDVMVGQRCCVRI